MQNAISTRSGARLAAITCAALGVLLSLAVQAKDPCGSQESVPEADRLANRISWVTKSEVMSSHFEVFRAEQRDGEYQKLNAEPIAGEGWSNRTKRYEYVDSDIDPCKSYFYYVDAISAKDQFRDRIVPPTEAKPKAKRNGES